MATILAWLKIIAQLYSQFLVLIGMIEKAEHDAKFKKIADAAATAADPTKTDEEKEDATHDLEDIANKHS